MARSCEDASDWIDRVVCLVTTDATWAGVAVAIVGVLLTLLALVTGVLRWIVERIKPRAAPEPNEIVDSLVELYRLPDVKDTEQLRSQRNSLKEMVTMLRERMLTSSREERARIIVAMTALRNGEIEPAEKLFGKILDEKSEIGNAAFEDAAKAARNLGELQFLRNIPEAVRSYEQAVELDPVNLRGWNRLGHFRRREGKPGLALEAFNKVLEIGQSEGDRNAIALATGNLGLVNQDLGDLGEAERLHREALKLNSDLGKEDRQADNYSNLGFVFQERGELNRAEEYHRMALRIDEKLENKEEMAIDYGRLGRIHQSLDDLEETELLHKAALKINTELNLQEGVAREHGNLGLVHMRRKELDEAQRFFGMALDAYTNLGHVLGIAEQKRNLGELANQRGDRGAACRIWADALRLSRDIGARSHSEQTLRLMRDAGCRNIPVRPSDALHD